MTPPRFDPFDASLDATAELWARLARPFDTATTVDALLGLSTDVVEQLVGVLVATCDEAETLLHDMPRTLRTLKTSVGSHNERCVGELRGPVQWSETVSYTHLHSLRFVGSRLVLRLHREIGDDELARLNADFGHILERGEIERIDVTDAERRDDDQVDLHRIAFRFDRRSWAGVRQLIDALNDATPPATPGV